MKQFYYGNIFEENGYHVLASSDMIPDSVMHEMESVAQKTIPTADNDVCGLILSGSGRIFFNTALIPPKLEKGENRPTFFSHQYYIEHKETGEFIKAMPSMLRNTEFNCRYLDSYDVSKREIRGGNTTCAGMIGPDAVDAAREMLSEKGHMLIYSENITCNSSLRIMSDIVSALNEKERSHISFVTEGADDSLTEKAVFIFCGQKRFSSLKNRYYKNCIYYNADTGNLIRTDEKLNLGHTGKRDSYQEYRQDIINDVSHDTDADDIIHRRKNNSEENIPTVRKKTSVSPLLLLIIGFVLGFLVGAAGMFSMGNKLHKKPEVTPPAQTMQPRRTKPPVSTPRSEETRQPVQTPNTGATGNGSDPAQTRQPVQTPDTEETGNVKDPDGSDDNKNAGHAENNYHNTQQGNNSDRQ